MSLDKSIKRLCENKIAYCNKKKAKTKGKPYWCCYCLYYHVKEKKK